MTPTERWAAKRKQQLDRKAVAMIEGRMQQEAAEKQLYEGWRAAAADSIRSTFRETALINKQVEKQLALPHTRRHDLGRSQSSLGFTHNSSIANTQSSWPTACDDNLVPGSSSPASPDMSPEAISSADHQVAQLNNGFEAIPEEMEQTVNLGSGGRRSPTSSATREELQAINDADEYMVDVDRFDASIDNRLVSPNQRLRSLSLDSTKSWTRPARTMSSIQ
eukprot:TRINITY_DN11782_c0_g1_i1.p1 TRINITY_DN11782_c0_g1~~TRINITY_DN11782_c0_g1_i1.p1  ORF type:complete len:221 (+),score=44.50 TRINITY_DN11782_c0_g1_i1:552-1214(+)